MEYILQENNLLMKKIIMHEYIKIFDKYLAIIESLAETQDELIHYSKERSIAEFYSEYFIDYHLKSSEVTEYICYCLVKNFQEDILDRLFTKDITEEEIDMFKLIKEASSISDILEELCEDYDLFKILFKNFITSNSDKKNNGQSRKLYL